MSDNGIQLEDHKVVDAHTMLDDTLDMATQSFHHMGIDQEKLEEHTQLKGELHALVDQLEKGEVPDSYPLKCVGYTGIADPLSFFVGAAMKTVMNQFGMWAIIDKAWTKELAGHIGNRHVLEVMAGAGWLASALRGHGVEVTATDDSSWRDQHMFVTGDGTVSAVVTLDALEAVKTTPQAEVLVVSWPPYKDNLVVKVCDEWGCDRPIIFIGEGRGGCTACPEFFDNFECEMLPVDMPRHQGIHDRVYVGHWTRLKGTQYPQKS